MPKSKTKTSQSYHRDLLSAHQAVWRLCVCVSLVSGFFTVKKPVCNVPCVFSFMQGFVQVWADVTDHGHIQLVFLCVSSWCVVLQVVLDGIFLCVDIKEKADRESSV